MTTLCDVNLHIVFEDPKGNIHRFSTLKETEKINIHDFGFEIDQFTVAYDYKQNDVRLFC